MKKVYLSILCIVILLLSACGSNAPSNVKKGFEYYSLMNNVIMDVFKGADFKESYNEHLPKGTKDEMIEFINSFEGNTESPLEEHVMADNLELLRLKLMTISLEKEFSLTENKNADYQEYSSVLEDIMPVQAELESYFAEYGLEYKE